MSRRRCSLLLALQDMGISASIALLVLLSSPTVAPDLSYDDLDIINNGAMAEPVFLESIDSNTSTERSAELREALLRYCKLDTEAMVRLAHSLEGRSG